MYCVCREWEGGDKNFQINKTDPLKLTLLTSAQFMLFIMKRKKFVGIL